MNVTTLVSKLRISMLLLASFLFFTNCESDNETIPETINKSLNVSVPNLTGYYSGSDNGHYYIRQTGNEIFWLGEDPSGKWANVFNGTLEGNKITGTFYDVPKGTNVAFGPLQFEVNGTVITKTSGPGFGGNTLTKTTRPSNLPAERAQGFGTRNNINDMTAKWQASDRGSYYIRQVGDTIIWFGEQNYTSGRPAWSNVAFGTRTGNIITLDWVDVPKGNNGGSGRLTLKIDSANKISRISATGGFGGRIWNR
ncbi:hypothetical protein ACWGOQ_0016455 [Aquimarina sp. M1]